MTFSMCFLLFSCSDDDKDEKKELKEEVKFTISEELETNPNDRISFYTTALKTDKSSGWKYEISDKELLSVFYESHEPYSTGAFGNKYENGTIIFEPKKEGSAVITFTLERDGKVREEKFSVTVSKSKENKNVLKIKAEKSGVNYAGL